MNNKIFTSEHFSILKHLLRWTCIIIPIAIAIGSMVALFLWLLNLAIHFRFHHTYILYLLPVAGVLIYFIYKFIGASAEKGNNLIIDEIHVPGGGVPKRMAPIVLITTIITHLFGGSAGREGTAVQIGGSIAQMFGQWFKLNKADMRIVLISGIAAGFGAVFGTPLTGAIFAMEVLTIGRIQYNALLPCLIASIIGDVTVAAWGVHHTAYHIDIFATAPHWFSAYLSFDFILLFKIIIASVAFGLASYLFAWMVHGIKAFFVKRIPTPWLIPILGGLIIIGLTAIIGKPDYLSLGVDAEHAGAVTIPSAFHAGGADTWSWLWKTIYTTVTLATGFKGGEVTPLFYIGATLGNTLSVLMDAPVGLFAALGFIAVFAGATNTPLACTIMGVELFGGQYILFFAVACFTAYFFSGHSGIYSAQRIGIPKISGTRFSDSATLSEAGARRQSYIRKKMEKYGLSKAQKND
ncbi:voltage-gated chloride channel family protein [Mucilaginibacter sp. SP1R1]|uniref:voltage-gated chloride channel family protein n=1 Tax=Mucilaginibacter sp. SP1R1 TaxID=2723091 RepID=UPI00161DAE91|nr:voltage-gated chloride channel family protein [Mucilaginibacter sp. SP1R1]MBB6151737.1 H+/Cl- antiporter ClcA [Mucilaginibacter sp. SP1R1]